MADADKRAPLVSGDVLRQKKASWVQRYMELTEEEQGGESVYILATYKERDGLVLSAVSCAEIDECSASGGTKWHVKVHGVEYVIDSSVGGPSSGDWVTEVTRAMDST